MTCSTVSKPQCFGVDGCPAGWAVAHVDAEGRIGFGLFETLESFVEVFPEPQSVWIDMPIGLASRHQPVRACDKDARKILGPKLASRVFTPPLREAIDAAEYKEACRLNRDACGNAISIQSWNIVPKIKELDALIKQDAKWQSVFAESHPEVCFAQLNAETPISESKKVISGRKKRLEILQQYNPYAIDTYLDAVGNYKRKAVQHDDIIDALALAISSSVSLRVGELPCGFDVDYTGLLMRIVYPVVD